MMCSIHTTMKAASLPFIVRPVLAGNAPKFPPYTPAGSLQKLQKALFTAHHLTDTGARAHLKRDSPPGGVIDLPADARQLGPIGSTQGAAFLGVLVLVPYRRLLEGLWKLKLLLQDVL